MKVNTNNLNRLPRKVKNNVKLAKDMIRSGNGSSIISAGTATFPKKIRGARRIKSSL